MLDAELVTRKMLLITRDLTALDSIARKSLGDYLTSHTDEVLVERYLERVIGRMIDINYHVLTEAGYPPPPDYYESFTQLAQVGIIDHDFAHRLSACAGLRNRLVHEYDELDPRKVHEALQAAMADVPRYLRHVSDYVARTLP